jgi:hypothetical protein
LFDDQFVSRFPPILGLFCGALSNLPLGCSHNSPATDETGHSYLIDLDREKPASLNRLLKSTQPVAGIARSP